MTKMKLFCINVNRFAPLPTPPQTLICKLYDDLMSVFFSNLGTVTRFQVLVQICCAVIEPF